MNDEAQLNTLEGLGAAILITVTVIAIVQSSVIVGPHTEDFVEVQLKQMITDGLTILDVGSSPSINHNLVECVASWNEGQEADIRGNNLTILDEELSNLFPDDLLYNVDFAYVKNDALEVNTVIFKGVPADNSVTARHLVTLYNSTVISNGGTWVIPDDELKVVEVRLTAWQI